MAVRIPSAWRGGQEEKEGSGRFLLDRLTGVSGASGHEGRADCQVALIQLFLLVLSRGITTLKGLEGEGWTSFHPSLISWGKAVLISSDSAV